MVRLAVGGTLSMTPQFVGQVLACGDPRYQRISWRVTGRPCQMLGRLTSSVWTSLSCELTHSSFRCTTDADQIRSRAEGIESGSHSPARVARGAVPADVRVSHYRWHHVISQQSDSSGELSPAPANEGVPHEYR